MIGHFHSHTHYSILDGAMTVDQLVERALQRKISAVALTEHGNIFSAVEFFFKAKEAGLKPIIGCEVYVAPRRLTEKLQEEGNFHLTVLVKNEIGYRNLCLLLKIANIEGFYRKPRIDVQTLLEYKEGLVVLSGCLNGILPRLIVEGKYDEAFKMAELFKYHFREDFYLELMRGEPADPHRETDIQAIARQRKVNDYLLEFSEKLKIPVVATADSHYADPADFEVQDMLVAISYGEKLNSSDRKFRYKIRGLYLKSYDEMKSAFGDIPQAIETHQEIIKKCNFEFEKARSLRIPKPPEFGDPDETIRRKAEEGLKIRLEEKRKRGEKFDENLYWDRLRYELDIISQKGFSSYFLVVEDFIRFAKNSGIAVGPGRGSAAGALTSWSLRITELDPIKYGLLFERFLNPEREKPPDIDIDFCKEKRESILDYVKRKYGEDHVAHIVTFGTFGARAAIRDVGRILGEPIEDVSTLAELVPQEPSKKWTLEEAYQKIPELKDLVDSNHKFKTILEKAKKIEGLIRHVGSHASGFVISDKPITEYTSISRSKDEFTTHFDMESLEKIGLVKFDFLGLETLTVVDRTFKLIKQRYGIELSFESIPLDDKKTYEMLKKGDVFGVFQFESAGMREMLMKLEPENIYELIAAVALYRPGPIQSGMVSDFIEKKKGLKPIEYPHPKLEPILKETYGSFLYQEQIMLCANILAGFTMGEADILREAMGKKKAELMESIREKFISGCVKNGIEKGKAEEIFDIMEKFAGYAFNKSHSAAYAFLSYVTAYLKANYPLEYISVLLSSEMGNFEKLTSYIETLLKLGYKILPPSISRSSADFTVEGDAIRFGLGGIKGLGESAIESILKLREKLKITSFEGFLNIARNFGVNKKVIETLVKAGAFDEMIDRKKALHILYARLSGELSLSLFKSNNSEISDDDIQKWEIETIGVLLSSQNTESKITEISKGFLPLDVRRDISEVVGIVKDILILKSGYLVNLQVSNGKVLEVILLSPDAGKIRKGDSYVFLGKRSGNILVSDIFFKIEDSCLVIKVTSGQKVERLKEVLRKQEAGNMKVVVEVNGNIFAYRKSIDISASLKEELLGNGFLAVLLPRDFVQNFVQWRQ